MRHIFTKKGGTLAALQLSPRQLPLDRITGSGLTVIGGSPGWTQAVDQGYAFNWSALHTFGTGDNAILLDSANNVLRSNNFTGGVKGWRIANSNAEFNDGTFRGQIRTAVLSFDETLVRAGTDIIAVSAGVLSGSVTTPVSGSFTISIKDPPSGTHAPLFGIGDLLQIKTGLTNCYMQVLAVNDMTTYYSFDVNLLNGSSNTYYSGTAVIDYGNSIGQGFLYMSASSSGYGPMFSVRGVRDSLFPNACYLKDEVGDILTCEDGSRLTRDGTTVTDVQFDEYCRLGSLNGIGSIVDTSRYGVFIGGSPSNYIMFDPVNGMIFSGVGTGITAISGGNILTQTIDANKLNVNSLDAITANMGNLSITGSIVTSSNYPQIQITSASIVGFSAINVPEFYLDAKTGKAFAGGGALSFDSTGMAVDAITGKFGSAKIKMVSGATTYGELATSVDLGSVTGFGLKSYDCNLYLYTGTGYDIYISPYSGRSVFIQGDTKLTNAFSCNNANPQTAYATGATLSAYSGGTYGLSAAADMQALVNKVIAHDAALKANGICS